MALTLTKIAAFTSGNKRHRVYDVTFDSSYPTGGESLTASDVNLRKIEQLIVHGPATATRGGTTGVLATYDYTNSKLQAFWGNAGTASVLPEVTDTTDIATQICRITAIGY
jgi:hypothetical protein